MRNIQKEKKRMIAEAILVCLYLLGLSGILIWLVIGTEKNEGKYHKLNLLAELILAIMWPATLMLVCVVFILVVIIAILGDILFSW